MKIPKGHLLVGRVLSHDDDTVVLEVGKRPHVILPNEGDVLHTLLFVHSAGDEAETWLPWEDDGRDPGTA